jgi:cell division protease FtsH
MVTRYGMDEQLGYVTLEPRRQQMLDLPDGLAAAGKPVSEATQQRIDEAIRGIVMGGFARASAILHANRAVLESGARSLLDKETLEEPAIRALAAQLQRS